jgi:hypothetical protein
MDTIFGYLTLYCKLKSSNFRKFFNSVHPDANLVTFVEGSIKDGQLLDPSEYDNSRPVEEGHFFIGANAPELPFVLEAPYKKLSILSFLTGHITNSKYVSQITDLDEPVDELTSPAKLLLRINNISASHGPDNDDESDKNNYTNLIRQKILPNIEGSWEGTILYHASKPSFILHSSQQAMQLHLVYFDGVYALVWSNSKDYLDKLWAFINNTNYNNRIYVSRNTLGGKTLMVIHPIYAISKFKRAYTSSKKYSEQLLAFPIMERYLSKTSVA